MILPLVIAVAAALLSACSSREEEKREEADAQPDAEGRRQIREACESIETAGFPIETGDDHSREMIPPSESRFVPSCETVLEATWARQRRERPQERPRLWNRVLVEHAREFARRHGLLILWRSYQESAGLGRSSFALKGRTLLLRLDKGPSQSLEDLEYVLDHEYGHFRDQQLVEMLYSRTRDAFRRLDGEGSEPATIRDRMAIFTAYLDLMVRRVPEGGNKRGRFVRLATEIFSHNADTRSLDNALRTMTEMFRMGEEVYDGRLRGSLFHPNMRYLKRPSYPEDRYRAEGFLKSDGTLIDLGSLQTVGVLRAAGFEEEFRSLPDFDPDAVERLNSDYIDFFWIAVRASSEYFPTVGPHHPL